MQKRIPEIIIAILVIFRIFIGINTYIDDMPDYETQDSKIITDEGNRSLIDHFEDISKIETDSKKIMPKQLIHIVLQTVFSTLFFIFIGLGCFVGFKLLFNHKQRNLVKNNGGGIYHAGEPFEDLQDFSVNVDESAKPMIQLIKSNDKHCQYCSENNLKRIPRKWYLRLIPGSKRYRCYTCRSKFTVLLWRIIIFE